ncbi:MAG TPA: nitrilase-related carbon-nitrogen hydrolase, partial [Cyclobacteriaceae bacterium]|nr:nitrilase-related carbon-nitrogen hydrolase [Cyclobacteriaceae bacterium]
MLKLAGATLNQIPIHWENNTGNILAAIEEARKQDVKILLMPELCITGYGCEDILLSDWLSEKAAQELQKIIPACKDITACVGLPIRINKITYNGAAVIRNGELLGITLKQNLAREGVHYEPRWFDPWVRDKVVEISLGGQSVQVGDLIYETDGIRFGFEICEDAWSRNRPGYRLHERHVDLILNPSASHFALGKAGRREKEVVIDGSEKFECAYLFVNHLGNEAGRMIYDGDIVFGQNGKLIAINDRLSFKKLNLLTCNVDFKDPSKSQVIPVTDGRERNDEFVRSASLALFDYLRKSKAKGFVLSLSGGADSSLCAVLVSEMVRRASDELGWETFWTSLGFDGKSPSSQKEAVSKLLTCAYQSTRNSSTATLTAAKTLAESIGAGFHQWSIDEESDSYKSKIEGVLKRKLTWEADDIALQNIQARSRSPIIWLLANVKQSILLTTSNRSEGDVGYATMDGDTSGSLAPIAGIDKPFILQWLRWAERKLGYSGLAAVNSLQPTAELRPSERAQTDEKDLMPYEVLLAIERLAIYERRPPFEVFENLKSTYDPKALKQWIRKFFKLWSANQWKRERLAPSFHFDDLNIDPR